MTYYVTKPAVDNFKAYINANYETYLALIRTASGYRELTRMAKVCIDNDYVGKGRVKPYMILDPSNNTPDDEGSGCIESVLNFDVIIACEGASSEEVTGHSMCYADAFQSMILSDDTLGDTVQHASVVDFEYYTGGVGMIKYVLLNVELTVNTDRS